MGWCWWVVLGSALVAACASGPAPEAAAPRREVVTTLRVGAPCPEMPAEVFAGSPPPEGERDDRTDEFLRKACQGGELEACFQLAAHYDGGRMVMAGDTLHILSSSDRGCARRLYERACQHGHLRSCSNLGLLLVGDKAPAEDAARGVELLSRACDGGLAIACWNLGMQRERGGAAPEDRAEAVRLYRLACGGGFEHACARLDALGETR